MTEEFTIDGVCYVVNFTGKNELHFYADVRKSEKTLYDSWAFFRGFWDDPPLRIWTKTNTGNVFKIKRKILKFLEHALRRYSPYYFTFEVLEESRLRIYEKIARRIGKDYGYSVTWGNNSFRFTRLAS
jgi:hypothetical protein